MIVLTSCGSPGPRAYQSERDHDGWIGVYVQDLDRELRRYLDLDERYGALINNVVSGGPADDAGLQEEDLIIKFDGKRIRDTDDLIRAVRRTRPDKKVELEIIRDKQKKTVQLTVGERRSRYRADDRRRDRRVTVFRDRPWLGIRLAEINADLAPYFSVEENAGVLILEVEKNSPAEKAKLKAGDVILEIANRTVRSVEDVFDILADFRRGDEIEIKIQRRGEEQTVKVTLERPPRSYHFDYNNDEMRAWKNEWRDQLRRLQHDLKYNLRPELRDLDKRIRIEIEDKIRRNLGDIRALESELNKFGEDFGAEMEKFGRELEREMEKLAEELERMEIELRFDRARL
jgi:C-terminal processing protease CtpA/Prc